MNTETTTQKIKSIRKIGQRRVVNLTVDKNHTFICSNGMITHNCERLSQAAQESLKGLLEELSKNCSFILTTNDISRIDSRLLSRCRRYDYVWDKTQEKQVMLEVLRRTCGILNNRGIPFDEKAVTTLVRRSFPDNRSLLGTLQDYSDAHGKIDLNILNHISGFNFNGIIDIIKNNDFKSAAQWALKYHEQQGPGLYGALFRYLCPYESENLPFKIEKQGVPALCLILNEAQKPKNIGPDSYVHLLSTLLELINNQDIRPSA